MATKPTDLPDWDTGDTNSLEPTSNQKTSGISLGSVITRRRLNWMFQALGKWMRYLDENVADKTNNLSDLPDIPAARANLGVESQTAAEAKYFQISNELSEGDAATKRTNIDVYSKSESDGRYVNETDLATDSETQTGTATDKAVTPASLSSRTATTTRTGLVEKATTTEAVSGTGGKFIDASLMQHALLNPNDMVAKRQAIGVYAGHFTSASVWVTNPSGWTVSYGAGRYLITHNLGDSDYTVTANVVGRPALNADSVHIQNITDNTFQLEAVDSDDSQRQRDIMFHLVRG